MNLATISAGKVYGLKVIETTEGNDPYPTWNYDYVAKSNDDQMAIMQALAKKINDDNAVEHKQNQRLVTAKVTSDATYGNFTMGGTTPILTVTNGSPFVQIESAANDGTIDVVANDLIAFDAAAAPTDAIGDIYKVLSKGAGNDAIITLNRPYTGATQTFTAAEANGTRVKKVTVVVAAGLEFTTVDFDVHFRLAVYDELVNADINYATAFVKGNGTYDQVLALEKEGQEMAGETTKNIEFASDWGQMDTFSVAGETYQYYHFELVKSERGMGVEAVHSERSFITIAVAQSSGNVDSTLDTLFGL